MEKKDIHTIVLPDIHGRIFWKSILQKYSDIDVPIIFLGDYLDPYDFEGISKKDAIVNFQEIIDIAKIDKRIHLLIGNHDMHYWYDAEYKCRVDSRNYNKIKDMFLQNFTLFDIAYEEIIDDEKFLYTHAGVTSYWLNHLHLMGQISCNNNKEYRTDKFGNKIKKISDEQLPFCEMLRDMTPDADKLNKMKLNWQGQANLWMCSWSRGGDSKCGSCIWEDLSEWGFEGSEIPGIWQVFGHSRWSKKDPDNAYINYGRKFACVDTATGWIITNKKEFIKI